MPSRSLHIRRPALGQQGFTLLEMIVVIALLAAVAYIATGAFQNVIDTSDEQLAYSEMREIASAIRQFRQDTGYYPGEGPFGLSSDGVGGQIADPTEGQEWFKSPANFEQLFEEPTTDNAIPDKVFPDPDCTNCVMRWNPETGRGWRGPYLEGFAEGYVDISDDVNGDPTGSPVETAPPSTHIPDVPGIADPFEYRAETVSGNTLLDWDMISGDTLETWGRPYLYFYDSTTGDRWLVSMGPDGDYDEDDDNIILNIE